jgi:glucokinase
MPVEICVGIDIGGTNTAFAFVDLKGQIVYKDSIPTGKETQPQDLVDRVCEKISAQLSAHKNDYRLVGIGIGAPNGNYFNGTIEFAPNLSWRGIIPIAKYFSDRMSVPAYLTNDANAAALGEMFFGAAKGVKDFIFVTLGTGLGSGIVCNGEMIYGHDGFAGELGHTIVVQHGRQCGCGRRGCLEQYCSATGLVKTYLEILTSANPENPILANKELIDSKFIYEKAMGGDEDAFYAFNYTGEMLGFALANSVAYTSPKAIFLFGGLASAGELLFNPTILSFDKNILNIYKNKVSILPSALPENDAALLGSASLAWNELQRKK